MVDLLSQANSNGNGEGHLTISQGGIPRTKCNNHDHNHHVFAVQLGHSSSVSVEKCRDICASFTGYVDENLNPSEINRCNFF